MKNFIKAKLGIFVIIFALAVLVTSNCDAQSWRKAPHPIKTSDEWMRASMRTDRTAQLYMSLENIGFEKDFLTKVETPYADHVRMYINNIEPNTGKVDMREVASIPLTPNVEVAMSPGGFSLMLIGLNKPLNMGYDIPVTMYFKNAGIKRVRVPVKSASFIPKELKRFK